MPQSRFRSLAYALVIIGGLNWGLVGLLNLNLVELILGFSGALVRIVYILVGLSAVMLLVWGDSAPKPTVPASPAPPPAVPPPPAPEPPRPPTPPEPRPVQPVEPPKEPTPPPTPPSLM